MVSELTALKSALKEAKKNAWIHEIGNDFYYTSKQKEEDDAIIKRYEEQIKAIESGNN